MEKAMVYSFLAIAFIIFFFSLSKRHGHHRMGLNRRLGHKVSHFDPSVSRIERSMEDKGLSKNITYVPEIEDAQEYFQDDGILNTTLRLMILFPLLDNAPNDGFISAKELGAWISQQAIDRLSYGTDKVISCHDKNGDGAISFEKNSMGHGEAGWWMEQFKNADVDLSGNLDFNECKERMDDDHDGKLNFNEFPQHAYNIYKGYADFGNSPALTPTAEEKFAQLDTDKDNICYIRKHDKYYTAVNALARNSNFNPDCVLIPTGDVYNHLYTILSSLQKAVRGGIETLLRYLHPGELFYAKYFTRYLMREADDNKDGYLTLQEMLNHESIFYNSLYEDDDDNDDDYHDEL